MRWICACLLLFVVHAAAAQQLRAPAQVSVDGLLEVELVGAVDPKAFLSIVAVDAAEGSYDRYVYARSARVEVPVPAQPGRYQLRLLGPDRPYPTLASLAVEVVQPEVDMQAPAEVAVGSSFEVQWRGPSQAREYVTLVPAGTPDGEYADYAYARGEGSGTLSLQAPSTPGAHELRYMSGTQRLVLGRRALQVGDVGASLEFAPSIGMGENLSIRWQGPGNPRDYITIVAPEAADADYGDYVYVEQNPVDLVVPETPGRYEVRYLSADGSRVHARAPLQVGAATASVEGPAQVEAGQAFEVRWQGPDNEVDYIAVTQPGQPREYLTWSYTRRGNPLELAAPQQPGRYELHYLTGRSNQSLASRPIEVTPGQQPGTLQVLAGAADSAAAASAGAAAAAGGSIELILDASGSMLQRLDGERRIDIARGALRELIERDIAPATPVALRVFGHRRPDACDTELLQPLAPLDRAALAATVAGIEAKNLARTPIGASLAAVAEDLAAVEGRATVILLTDGEETCDGDPEAEIRRLRSLGFEVVINIVGFAVDEYALEQRFRSWAALGGGAYFAANDAAALRQGIRQAASRTYAVYQDGVQQGAGTIGGPAIPLRPGRYELRIGESRREIEIRSGAATVERL